MTEDKPFFADFDLSNVDFLKILSEFDEGVMITDAAGRVVFYNHTQAAIDQLDPQEVLGRRVTDIYRLSDENSMIMRCINSGQPILNQIFFYRPHPQKLCNAIHTIYPLKTADRINGAICFIRNSDIIEKAIGSSASLISEEEGGFDNGTNFTFSNIIGADPAFLSCLKRARATAGSKSPIMISGETGTGKEMFAQAIHNYSPRRSKPFVAVNCAAIPDNLQESTLFGTTRGAFTGSLDRPGLFEEARGGTLYLDEIDAMPENLQVKLLRVLQEKKIRRVGSPTEIKVDVRIISSTKMEFGAPFPPDVLRKDLYYRLRVVGLELPPLRERKQDIDALTRHFIDKSHFTMEARAESVSQEVMELFLNYDWPGNVRELEHVIEGAINIIDQGKVIDIDYLPVHFSVTRIPDRQEPGPAEGVYQLFPVDGQDRLLEGLDRLKSPEAEAEYQEEISLTAVQARREKEMIQKALEEVKGNISQAARRLGISRQLLHYKVKKFGIARKTFK